MPANEKKRLTREEIDTRFTQVAGMVALGIPVRRACKQVKLGVDTYYYRLRNKKASSASTERGCSTTHDERRVSHQPTVSTTHEANAS